MLTLERKEGESIVLYNDELEIEVVIQTVKNGRVKVQLDAPQEFTIIRNELLESSNG